MKVLLLSALYPPHIVGGAEVSAWNLANWLADQGWEIGVVRAAARDEEDGVEKISDNLTVWRVKTPHLYSVIDFQQAPAWQKPLWHLQDHFDPRIRKKIGVILDTFRPDLVNIHILQGLGYPALKEIAKRRIPINYVLPDLGLACVRMSMFKQGKDCGKHCGVCRLSARYKANLLDKQASVSFLSPSKANLSSLAEYFPPARTRRRTSILNPNSYPTPTRARRESDRVRLLYAGRLHESKGIDMLFEAAAMLASQYPLTLTIAGRGPMEAELRKRAEAFEWCKVLGFISHVELANEMNDSDLLCIPSIWAENSPGVVIQALGLGLPVMGSDRGGIPELVQDGWNGAIVEEASAAAWSRALERIFLSPDVLLEWRRNARATAPRFEQDSIGADIAAWMMQSANRTGVADDT